MAMEGNVIIGRYHSGPSGFSGTESTHLVEKRSAVVRKIRRLATRVQGLLYDTRKCIYSNNIFDPSLRMYLPCFCAISEARRLIPIAINALTTADHVGITCFCQ